MPEAMPEAFDVVIYHNPACGTSRNTLAMIRNAGIELHGVGAGTSGVARNGLNPASREA